MIRRYVKGAYWWTMGILATCFFITICLFMHLVSRIRGLPRDGRLVHPWAGRWGRFIFNMTPGWHIEVVGREYLPRPGERPAVLVCNHESMTDIFAMYFLRTQFRWLSKEELFRIPLLGHAMTWANYVPIHRGNKDSHALAIASSADRLHKGFSMFFFPEGTRSDDGTIRPFKPGAFKLARDEKAPVIPIVIQGARDLMPKRVKVPGKAKVTIRILPPQPPPSEAADSRDIADYAERVREVIVTEHARIAAAKAGAAGSRA